MPHANRRRHKIALFNAISDRKRALNSLCLNEDSELLMAPGARTLGFVFQGCEIRLSEAKALFLFLDLGNAMAIIARIDLLSVLCRVVDFLAVDLLVQYLGISHQRHAHYHRETYRKQY
jgi:hypothetical protein